MHGYLMHVMSARDRCTSVHTHAHSHQSVCRYGGQVACTRGVDECGLVAAAYMMYRAHVDAVMTSLTHTDVVRHVQMRLLTSRHTLVWMLT